MVGEFRGRAEDAVHHLRVDVVPLHVLDAQIGVGNAADVLLAVLVELGFRHQIGARVRARHVFRARGADAVFESEGGAVLARPIGSVRPVRDIGHAVLHRRRRLGHEKIGRHPAQIDVAIGGNTVVFHGRSSWGLAVSRAVAGWSRQWRERSNARGEFEFALAAFILTQSTAGCRFWWCIISSPASLFSFRAARLHWRIPRGVARALRAW